MIDDFMREEIYYQIEILKNIKNSDKKINLQDFDDIWLTGSGDSHCVSLFGASLGSFLGLPTKGLAPMNASYYTHFNPDKKILLLAISVSGKTPRVLEVIHKVKKNFKTKFIVGLTDNPHSDLSKLTDKIILLNASPSDVLEKSDYKDGVAKLYTGYHHDVAQTKTYFANILQILTIFYPQFFDKITYRIENFAKWVQISEKIVKNLPIANPQKTIFIGSGLMYSLTQFGQYKWFEFTFPGHNQDVEEYAHTHYFTTDEETTVIFLAPTGPLLERTTELIKGALGNLIKPQIFVITDMDLVLDSPGYVINVLSTFKDQELLGLDRELIFYLYALILVEWFSYHTAKNNGLDTNNFRGGKDGEKYVRGSYQTIRKSKIHE
jgi:fructoselysine-6-P-deglycase FrlB-like protein